MFKRVLTIACGILWISSLTGCALPAKRSTDVLSIDLVRVGTEQVLVAGKSSLPDGTCILTELQASGQRAKWWPATTCAIVHDGEWHMAVSLGQGDSPTKLEAGVLYELRARQQGHAPTGPAFPFELSGPPTPMPTSNDRAK